MVLPSIHASNEGKRSPKCRIEGTLKSSTSKISKSGSDDGGNHKYTVADIDQLIQDTPDEDCAMIDMQDEDDVQNVSKMLSNRRSSLIENQDEIPLSREDVDSRIPTLTPTRVKSLFVVDTNFLISHLGTLESLRRLGRSFHHQIVLPNTVIRELDGLKNSSKEVQLSEGTESIGKLARRANDWIYKNLANLNSAVMGQKLGQAINSNCVKDDAILDCGLYFKEKRDCFVILLSNDKNLCVKALTENLLTVTFKKGMTAELIASMTYNENLSLFGPGAPNDEPMDDTQVSAANFIQRAAEVYREITTAVTEAIIHVINDEYGEDIDLLGFQADTLTDLIAATHCLEKFWISVFAEYFKRSRIKKNDWKGFPDCLTSMPTSFDDLKNLVNFWGEILKYLFIKRCDEDNENLEKSIQYWTHMSALGS